MAYYRSGRPHVEDAHDGAAPAMGRTHGAQDIRTAPDGPTTCRVPSIFSDTWPAAHHWRPLGRCLRLRAGAASGDEGRARNGEKRNADAARDRSLRADPIEVSLFTCAGARTWPSRAFRDEFDRSSGRYCHHAHPGPAQTGRGTYFMGWEPGARALRRASMMFRIFPAESSSEKEKVV